LNPASGLNTITSRRKGLQFSLVTGTTLIEEPVSGIDFTSGENVDLNHEAPAGSLTEALPDS
jgi:hypothetical protein